MNNRYFTVITENRTVPAGKLKEFLQIFQSSVKSVADLQDQGLIKD